MRGIASFVPELSSLNVVETGLSVDIHKDHFRLIVAHFLHKLANILLEADIGGLEVRMRKQRGVALIEQLLPQCWCQFPDYFSLRLSFPQVFGIVIIVQISVDLRSDLGADGLIAHVDIDQIQSRVYLRLLHVELLHDGPDLVDGVAVEQAGEELDDYGEGDLSRVLGGDVAVADGDHGGGGPVQRVRILHREVAIVLIEGPSSVAHIHHPVAFVSAGPAIGVKDLPCRSQTVRNIETRTGHDVAY